MFSASSAWRRMLNIIGRILTLVPRGIYYYFKHRKHLNYNRLEGKAWLFVISKNNRDVLRVLKKNIPEAVYLTYETAVSEPDDIVSLLHVRTFLHLYRFPLVWWGLYKKYGKRAWSHADYIFKAIGQYEASRHFIKKYQPKYIVFANDHPPLPRAMMLAAKSLDVPTVYVQHASVTLYFPPLLFDLNLLEGQDTLNKYQENGEVQGEVRFIGMPKFDAYTHCRNTNTRVKNIGICCNKMDEVEALNTLMAFLAERLPDVQISFRPHPTDVREFRLPVGVLRSNATEEPIFEFLQKQDLIIAGNTSTHLEAVLLNVVSIYYEFSPYPPEVSDMYGYYKNGLVEKANTPEHLIQLIEKQVNKKENVVQKAQPYNSVIGTAYEGKSGELAVKYIDEFMKFKM